MSKNTFGEQVRYQYSGSAIPTRAFFISPVGEPQPWDKNRLQYLQKIDVDRAAERMDVQWLWGALLGMMEQRTISEAEVEAAPKVRDTKMESLEKEIEKLEDTIDDLEEDAREDRKELRKIAAELEEAKRERS